MATLFQKGKSIYQRIMKQFRIKGIDDVIQAQEQKKTEKENNTRSEQSAEHLNVCTRLIEIDGRIEELSKQVSNFTFEINNKIDTICNSIFELKNHNRLDRSFLDILLFIQHLDRYLFDKTINPEFAEKVRQDIKGVLSSYGYRIVDFDETAKELSKKHYDIEYIDSGFMIDSELVYRAIVDTNDNTIVRGKVYINPNK